MSGVDRRTVIEGAAAPPAGSAVVVGELANPRTEFVGTLRHVVDGADHTALHLHTTTEPTGARLHTLAQVPAYRLGRTTVRGHLRSPYADCHLGAEIRRVPEPALTLPEGADRHDDHA